VPDQDRRSVKGGVSRSLTREALFELVWTKPLAAVAADVGMSRNGLAKICDRLLVPYPGRGYWTRNGRAKDGVRPSLPPPPADAAAEVSIASGRPARRRKQTRLAAVYRKQQLVEAAAKIIAEEGVHAATMKRVAREAGISEAQAHNHFSRRTDLLVSLARRELDAMNAVRQSEVERAHDNLTRVTLSTMTYLRQVAERGAIIQQLLNLPDVRDGLRAERRAQRASAELRMTDRLAGRYGVDADLAHGTTVVLTAVCLRAGRLLAERKIPLEMAERLSLAIVTAGNRRITAQARAARLSARA
jgi:AcrR family transcriptional regulator